MNRTRKTVADMLAMKGRQKIKMLFVDKVEEAEAAAEAGIDMLSIIDPIWTPRMREAAGNCFVQVGLLYGELVTADDYMRAAFDAMGIGADCVYCAASLTTIAKLAAEGIPVVSHVGLVPSRRTWTGGFKAVGKTADSALKVFRDVKALEDAGAFAAELEVVPGRVGDEITKRTRMLMLGMGGGAGADAQYLFAEDVLGYTRGHRPRHAKVYRDFRTEYDRLQRERVAAFKEFIADVESGAYPEDGHLVPIDDAEFAAFMKGLPR
ncbi:MAG: 3-methyl-2-oxobutanoate hydroxymethyltransferase [Alphaproteobacteria bacterium]